MTTPTEERALAPARLLALADGIFAIAMTLLVFEIKLPDGAQAARGVGPYLVQLWPKLAACGLSFLTLGFSWIGHHNQYLVIRRTDRTFLWINLGFLASITFVPFGSALLGEFPFDRVAILVYAGNLAVAGTLLYAHWRYATERKRLVDAETPAEFIEQTARRVLIAPLAYLGVMALSAVSPQGSLVACLLIPLYFMLPGRVDRFWKGA